MKALRVVCIVEGYGEVDAVPIVVRRVIQDIDPTTHVHIPNAIRIPRSKILRPGELERAVELAAQKVAGDGGILILLDSDTDCPAQRGPELLARATAARSDIPIGVVLAVREFEAWFIAAAESLRGCRDLPQDITAPPNVEEIQGAKEWLSRRMPPGRAYSETLDQPALAARFDLQAARRLDSFDKFYREVAKLLASTP